MEEDMRTTYDRIRHTLGFELIGLAICIPLAVLLFDIRAHQAGVLAAAASLIAAGWNYVYNLAFDKIMSSRLGRLEKTWGERVFHALGFEGGLMLLVLPLAAWWLSISLWQALLIDIGFIVLYVVYAFFYNLAYDKVFPVPSYCARTK
jgi:uncharacterized membrane protein